MNIDKIKEDAEIASIDYADRYKVEYRYYKYIQWIVSDRLTKQDKVISEYNNISELPKAARKYRVAFDVSINIYDVDNSAKYETAETIVDKLNLLKDYPYHKKPVYTDYGRYIKVSYSLCESVILSAPKRIK